MPTYEVSRDYGGEDVSLQFASVDRTHSYVGPLSGLRGLRTYKTMADSDDTVGSMLWAIETTLGQLDWSHKAADNNSESTSPAAIKAAKFADTLLADMAATFSEATEKASTMVWAGFSIAEIMWKKRLGISPDVNGYTSQFDDGLWGVADIVERPAQSITGFVRTNGRITGVNSTSTTGMTTTPIEKILHHTIRGGTANPYGQSLLSNAYRSWVLKRDLQDSEAIGIRRELCGLPTARVPKRDMDLAQSCMAKRAKNDKPTDEEASADARIKAIIAGVTKMRFNETSGIVLPSDVYMDENGKPTSVPQYDFKMLTGSGQRAIDTRGPIRDYDRSIARTAMMQFLHLGDKAGGSYALSDSQSTLALRSIKALTQKFAKEWRLKVLTGAFILNQMDLRYLPNIESSPITEDSLQVIGKFLNDMATAQDLMDANPDLRAAMFARVGVAPEDNDVIEAPIPAPPSPALPDDPPAPPATPPAPTGAKA